MGYASERYHAETINYCHCGGKDFRVTGFPDTVACFNCGAIFYIGEQIRHPVAKVVENLAPDNS